MRRASIVLLAALALGAASAGAAPTAPESGFWEGVRQAIHQHLGRPYIWGATGLKGFDCSGFVWRVMLENGVRLKRTTARKLYMTLPRVSPQERWRFGNVVFFDNLKHCGIVDGPDTFYHAQTSRGTNLSHFDPFWRRKIVGVRGFAAAPPR